MQGSHFLLLQGSVRGVTADEMERIRFEADALRSAIMGHCVRRAAAKVREVIARTRGHGLGYRPAAGAAR
jgi:hypothetical protein